MGEAIKRDESGQGGPLANRLNANAFAAISQVATSKETTRINQAASKTTDSARDRWAGGKMSLLTKQIQDLVTHGQRVFNLCPVLPH